MKEARKHVDGEVKVLLENARKQYEIVVSTLETITKDYPFSQDLEGKPLGIDERTSKTVESLTRAKDAEEEGLRILQNIIENLP
ncbi:MAG: hypothetical protein RTV72_10495 [Candidatus Thorarchaeota archaeon]